MKRHASATWWGDLKSGNGRLSAESGALSEVPYAYSTRFRDERGTNPEELIGAAHAGCFSQALAMILADGGMTPARIDTDAAVSLEKVDDGFAITGVHLSTRIEVPGGDPEKVEKAAHEAKVGCPVGKALDVDITLDVTLVN